MPVSSKKFLDIQGTIKCRFTLKRVRDMIITFSTEVTSTTEREMCENGVLRTLVQIKCLEKHQCSVFFFALEISKATSASFF